MRPEDTKLKEQLRHSLPDLGLRPIDRLTPPKSVVASRRSGYLTPPTEAIELLSLTRGGDGVLRWEVGMPVIQAVAGGRRAGVRVAPGEVIEQFVFEKIEPNKVGSLLDGLDGKLTPPRGLRRWNPDKNELENFHGPDAAGKRVLLFIHGTFSNCDNTFSDLRLKPGGPGRELLAAAADPAKYDFILTFDHPTVGVSPAMNAFDLAAALRPLPKKLDVVAHSRGGLVARWLLEGFVDPAQTESRAVLVAATLAGTSLAAPHRIKAGFNLLANIGSVLGNGAKLAPHPFIVASGTLLSAVSSIIKFGTATPVLDAAVAMIPGLQGQSRVGNNPELLRLRDNPAAKRMDYSAVCADFQPRNPGWNFLQYFSKPLQRLEHWGADLVFEGANDLVVDVAAMNDLADDLHIPAGKTLDFGLSETVHHTNYFLEPKTLEFIRKQFTF